MTDNDLNGMRPARGWRAIQAAAGLGIAVAAGWVPYAIVDLGLREWATEVLDARDIERLALALPVATAVAVFAWFARRRLLGPGALAVAAGLAWTFAPLSTDGAALSATCALRLLGAWLVVSALVPDRGDRPIGRRLLAITPARFGLALFAISLAINAFVAWWVFGLRPSIIDTLDQTFQARIFAGGELTAPAPPVPRAFEFLYMIVRDGRWYSHYPPGHPLTLAIGVAFGATWLVGPTLGALLPVLVWRIGTDGWGRRTGRVAGVLALAAPYGHLMAGSHMSHTTCATALALGTWGLVRAWRGAGPLAGIAVGAGFGHALWTRPYPALAMAVAAVVATFVCAASRRRVRLGSIAAAVAVAAVPIALLLAYNHATNGHPLVFGYNVTQGPLHALGFGERTMNELVRDYTWWSAIEQTGYHLGGLNAFALGTLVPALALAPWALLARRRHPFDAPLALLAATPCIAFFFYPFTDMVLGPRLVFATVPFLCVLVARSLVRIGRVPARPRLSAPPALLALLAVTAVPDLAGAAWFNRRLHHDAPTTIAAFVREQRVGNALVICDARTFECYGFGELRPRLDRDRPLFVRDRHAIGLVRRFPEREALVIEHDADGRLRATTFAVSDDLFARVSQADRVVASGFEATTRTLSVPPIDAESHDLLFGFATPAHARFAIEAGPDVYLRMSAIVHPDAWPAGSDGVTFRVRVQQGDGAPTTVFDEHLGRGDAQMRLLDREIALPLAPGPATLWLEALPGPAGDATGDVFAISTPCLVTRRPR